MNALASRGAVLVTGTDLGAGSAPRSGGAPAGSVPTGNVLGGNVLGGCAPVVGADHGKHVAGYAAGTAVRGDRLGGFPVERALLPVLPSFLATGLSPIDGGDATGLPPRAAPV